jgi:hypothetical protein
MVQRAVPGEHTSDADAEPRLTVAAERIHLVVTTTERDIVADASRPVGNLELADRLETLLHQSARSARRERDA